MNIIKYETRQLYSTTDGKYVTIPVLASYIRAGGTIKVKCAVSRTDITTDVLKKCLLVRNDIQPEELYALLRRA